MGAASGHLRRSPVLAANTGKYGTGIALPIDAGFTIQQHGMNPKLGKQFAELSQELDAAKRSGH